MFMKLNKVAGGTMIEWHGRWLVTNFIMLDRVLLVAESGQTCFASLDARVEVFTQVDFAELINE